ncbi:esterase FE4 [Tribolium castaneum]
MPSQLTSVVSRMWSKQLLVIFFLNYLLKSQSVEVTTSLGKILGSTHTTRLGKTIFAFRGIRYAKAPTNELRFKPPVPVDPWPGTYNATEDGPVCPQPVLVPASEDCLFLNVYTTQLSAKRPVIIHLHAGGFYSATGRSNWGGPQYFLDQDIVLVTLNYRIGSLGFLSLGKELPGNNGLRDQVVAMKWVKQHIEHFGGDPNSVTLYGYSAGAWSINLHMVSPMSRGLFHKAILGSGSAVGQWPLPKNQIEVAKRQARALNCSDNNSQEILDCLKTKSAEELGNSLFQMMEFGINPVLIWSPVIEEDFGQERFLPDDPFKLIKKGNFEKIPIILGVTQDEFANMAFPMLSNATLLQMLSDNFEKYAPICFIYERETPKSRQVSKGIRKFYFNDEPLTNDSFKGLADAYADLVGFQVNRAANLISQYSTQSVYYYKFSYQGRYSHFYLPDSNGTIPYGVVHHDDLIYSFYISTLFPFFNASFPEKEMVQTLTTLWANFAKTGNPVSENKGTTAFPIWTPYDTKSRKYLDIGEKLVIKGNMFKERYDFWSKFYPICNCV